MNRSSGKNPHRLRLPRGLSGGLAASMIAALLAGACAESPTAPGADVGIQLARGNGNGGGPPGGGGGGADAPLTMTLGAGTVTSDGQGAYVDGSGGVTATMNESGAFQFLVGSGARQVFIGQIVDVDGSTERAPELGLHGIGAFSKACCNLRALGAGDSMPLQLEWLEPDTKYVASMGSSTNCSEPSGPPVEIVDRQEVGADTLWTLQSQGTALLCVIIDKKGKQNDSTTGYEVLFDFTLTVSTDNN